MTPPIIKASLCTTAISCQFVYPDTSPNHSGNKGWRNDPGFIPRGRLQWDTHEATVDHAPGFSGASAEHAAGFSGGVGLWAGVVRSSPGRRLTFSGNPGEFSSPPQNPGGHLPGILGKSGILTASFEGAPITTGEEAGLVSRDSAACED